MLEYKYFLLLQKEMIEINDGNITPCSNNITMKIIGIKKIIKEFKFHIELMYESKNQFWTLTNIIDSDTIKVWDTEGKLHFSLN